MRLPSIEQTVGLIVGSIIVAIGWKIRGNRRIWEHLSYIGWPRKWVESRSVWFPWFMMLMGGMLVILILYECLE